MLIGHLNIIRPLGLAGISIIVTVKTRDDFALRSRFVNGFCLVPGLEPEQQEATTEQLLAAGAELSATFGTRVPLLYGSDDALDLLHRFRGELERYYLLLLNDDDLAAALADKELFYRRCCDRGLLVPRTLRLSACGDAVLASFSFPVVVKPRTKVHCGEMKRDLFNGCGKARVIHDPSQLLSDPILQRYREDLVVSDLIPGGDEQLYSFHGFADERSDVLAWFAGRKIRTYPAATGESSFIELCDEPALAEVGKSFIARLGVRGPFKIDFKRSTADGLYYALEINARYNLWHYLGAVSGINLPAIGYRYLLDGPRQAIAIRGRNHYRLGFRWLNFYLDYHMAKELRRRGQMSYGRWFLSLLGRNVYSAFAWDDPLPFLRWLSDFIQKKDWT